MQVDEPRRTPQVSSPTALPALAVSTPSTGRSIAIGLLFCAVVVNFFDRAALSVANTTVRGSLHLGAAQMGWLLSAFSLAYGFAQLPLVALMQRLRLKLVLGTGLVVWSAAQVLTAAVTGMPVFLAVRVMLGVGEAPFYPCGVGIVRSWFDARARGRATAVMSMSQTLGLAIAPPLLTLLLLHVGWRVMFAVLGVAGWVVAALWFWLYRDAPQAPSAAETDNTTAPSAPPAENVWSSLLRRRLVWGMMLGFGGINYTNWLYTAWMPGYLQEARHLSLARTGWLAAVPFLAGAVGMFTSGSVADWAARRGFALQRVHRIHIVGGMVCSAAATLLVAHSGTTALAIAGLSAALFFIHFAGTSAWGYVQTVAEAGQTASLSALQNFASFVIASAAPVVTGILLDRTHSFTLALAVCSAVTLLGALCYLTLAAPPRIVRPAGV